MQGNGCGGTLVWADIVLTAAHCNGRFSDQVLVSAEYKNLPAGGAVYKKTLSSMMLHPNNQVGTYIYDFMMFRIEAVEGFEGKIMQTNSNRASPAEGEMLRVIGMGYTQEGGPTSEVLNYVDVLAYSDSDCVASYGSTILPEAMLCAGWPQGGKDSCNGDSGSPLFNSAGQQVGLTSFGSGCARAGKPGKLNLTRSLPFQPRHRPHIPSFFQAYMHECLRRNLGLTKPFAHCPRLLLAGAFRKPLLSNLQRVLLLRNRRPHLTHRAPPQPIESWSSMTTSPKK